MKVMKILKEFMFGVRVEGQPLPPPTFKTIMPRNPPTKDMWIKEFKVGSRYGHRGSFYNKTS